MGSHGVRVQPHGATSAAEHPASNPEQSPTVARRRWVAELMSEAVLPRCHCAAPRACREVTDRRRGGGKFEEGGGGGYNCNVELPQDRAEGLQTDVRARIRSHEYSSSTYVQRGALQSLARLFQPRRLGRATSLHVVFTTAGSGP